jgi:hypothetical protein
MLTALEDLIPSAWQPNDTNTKNWRRKYSGYVFWCLSAWMHLGVCECIEAGLGELCFFYFI